jgi:hypothetical protein
MKAVCSFEMESITLLLSIKTQALQIERHLESPRSSDVVHSTARSLEIRNALCNLCEEFVP